MRSSRLKSHLLAFAPFLAQNFWSPGQPRKVSTFCILHRNGVLMTRDKPPGRRAIGKRLVLAVVVAVAVGLFVLYLMMNPERKRLDEPVREQLGGSYLRLSQGVTHYALEGPEDGHVVVLVHGGTIPMFTWDEISPGLTRAGFRVLRYDMFGRGRSDRPGVEYNRALYLEQLVELLGALELQEPVDVVALSFGGATAVNFTAHYPDRVRKLALIAPLVHDYPVPAVVRPPVIGELFARFVGRRMVVDRARTYFGSAESAQRYAALFTEQVSYDGFQSSMLSMLRHDALTDYRDAYATVGAQDRRVLLIWGTRDSEITEEMIDTARALIPRVEFHAVDGAGHGIVFQNKRQVQQLLIDFLRESE